MSSRGLIASVIGDAQRLVSLEVALAKQEAKELAKGNAIAGGLIAFGAYVVIGLALVLVGKARMRIGLPPRTVESLKENKEWALRRVKSNGR